MTCTALQIIRQQEQEGRDEKKNCSCDNYILGFLRIQVPTSEFQWRNNRACGRCTAVLFVLFMHW